MQYWGLTERGFRRPSYIEILDAFEYKARELYGSKVNLTVRSAPGIFLRIFAWIVNLLWQVIEDVYNAGYVDTAVGTSLYNLGRFIGISLRPAQKATALLEIKGSPGTFVPAGFLAQTKLGVQYVSVRDVTLDGRGVAVVTVQAFKAGPDGNTGVGTITEIVNPVLGIDSIASVSAGEGGALRETDEQFRDRYYASTDFAGGVNADAIRAEILQKVEGIYSAVVYENDTDFYVETMAPHSIEALCYGGEDYAIAKAIYRRKAAGIQTMGGILQTVMSASDQPINIHFSRPEILNIQILITNLTTDSNFPENGREQIKEALLKYVGDSAKGGLPIGKSLYGNRLFEVVNIVSGVVDYDISISKDGINYIRGNVNISNRQKIITSPEGIVIY